MTCRSRAPGRAVGPPGRLSSCAALLLLMCACGGMGPDRAPATVSTGSPLLTIGLAEDLESVHPLLATSATSRQIHDLLFRRLLREEADLRQGPPRFFPDLALSWTWRDPGRHLDLWLDPTARWSDGRPLTAEDVVWTWRQQIDPDLAWPYAHAKDSVLEITADGPHHLRVRFREATAHPLSDLNEGPILPAHAWGSIPTATWRSRAAWFREHLVTSGPFELAQWIPGQRLLLRPRSTGPAAERGPGVQFVVLPDPTVRLLHLAAGQVHFLDGITPAQAASLHRRRAATILPYSGRSYDYLCWNTRRPWFGDSRVRRALTQAIDRAGMVRTLLQGRGRIGVGPIPQDTWAFDTGLAPWPFDREAAAAALDATGWERHDPERPRRRAGLPFRFELLVNAANPLRREAAAWIQSDLRALGVEVDVRPLDVQTLNALTEAGDFDAFLGAWAIDTSLSLRYAFHSASHAEAYNFGAFADPEIDRLIETLERSPAGAPDATSFAAIQRRLHDLQPYTFLWEAPRLAAAAPGLHGARPDGLSPYQGLLDWRLAPRGAP